MAGVCHGGKARNNTDEDCRTVSVKDINAIGRDPSRRSLISSSQLTLCTLAEEDKEPILAKGRIIAWSGYEEGVKTAQEFRVGISR